MAGGGGEGGSLIKLFLGAYEDVLAMGGEGGRGRGVGVI